MVITIISLYIVSIILAVVIAKKREGNVLLWTALAMTIGPLVLPLLPFIRSTKADNNVPK